MVQINPDKGFINKVRGNLICINHPELNVTVDQIGDAFFNFSYDGSTTEYLPTATGQVRSPNIYQPILIHFGLVKTLPLAQTFLNVRLKDSYIGDVFMPQDTPSLDPIYINTVSIQQIESNKLGMHATIDIILRGTVSINSNLFNL